MGENEKGTMEYGSDMRLRGVLVCEGREKETKKTCFSAGRAVCIHYFKNIRQGRYDLIL